LPSLCSRSNFSNSSPATGRECKYPCDWLHPMARRISNCPCVSTPSATTRSPNADASPITLDTSVTLALSCGSPVMNERSIFTRSTGSFDNSPSDEYPVPKSSSATRKPALRSSRSLRLAPSTSCSNPVSVISRSIPPPSPRHGCAAASTCCTKLLRRYVHRDPQRPEARAPPTQAILRRLVQHPFAHGHDHARRLEHRQEPA